MIAAFGLTRGASFKLGLTDVMTESSCVARAFGGKCS